MDSKAFIISRLNHALREELEAIHRYMIYHRVLEHKGYNKLASVFYRFSIEEMRHADGLMGRILFLGGTLEISFPGVIKSTEDIEEMFRITRDDETISVANYNKMASEFEERLDYESANLVTAYLKQEEAHADWVRKQLDIVDMVGLANYAAEHIGNGESPD